MKIAFTSDDGLTVNQHFGTSPHFYVWEVGPERAELVGKVTALASSPDEEDRIAARASAIADCAVVYTVQIGGPAAAKLVSRRIHPMKTGREIAIGELVGKLQEVLRGSPPPWLRKAMGMEPPPLAIQQEES
ncbi:MAG: nitrogen fixation protein NifX [Anaeromyxobacteraceae bacterium]